MSKIRFAALDGSLANFGIAIMDYDVDTGALSVANLILSKTEKSKVKTVRASSDNFARSRQSAIAVREAIKDCAFVFAEIPSGGQDYRSVLAFGMVIGIYASIPQEVFEVSPPETKMAAVGTKTASKAEMILWATEKFPDAPWLRYAKGGKNFKKGDIHSDNEHLADGVAIGHAGIQLPQFKQIVSFLKMNKTAA